MINFNPINQKTFLEQYWQKKPLLIKNGLPDKPLPIDANELAGLACEEDIESRIVIHNPNKTHAWELRQGPFDECDFATLPEDHWTLLVQGVDRFVPEVAALLNHFDFLPQWRVDDVMISYASLGGGVGPHFDNYDVFLYQAQGQRRWRLSTKNCHESNAIEGLDLRIMADFTVEEDIVLSEGDILYLPPYVAHDGVSLTEDCMTYSFGYRSYQAQELWDSFGDYLNEHGLAKRLYQDPNWSALINNTEIPQTAVNQAKQLMQKMLEDDASLQHWFSRFATQLDHQALTLYPAPLEGDEAGDLGLFLKTLHDARGLQRDPYCRLATYRQNDSLYLTVNGYPYDTDEVSDELVELVAKQRFIANQELSQAFETHANQKLIYELWKQQHLYIC